MCATRVSVCVCVCACVRLMQGVLELQPGCNMDQSLEAQVTGVLNNIREKAGKVRVYDTHTRAHTHAHRTPGFPQACTAPPLTKSHVVHVKRPAQGSVCVGVYIRM